MFPPFLFMIKLSKRLSAVAACIPAVASVIDVGTDHGLLPVYLAQNGLAGRIIASDIHPGPLKSAENLVRETQTQDKIQLFVRDGLDGFSRADADCVVIAGMGGENMAGILAAAPWTRDNVTLVLQPQSKGHVLRAFLNDNGYHIKSECLVADGGRIYPLLTACGGVAVEYSPAELYLGKWEQINAQPLLGKYLEQLLHRQEKAREYDEQAARLCRELRQWKERINA